MNGISILDCTLRDGGWVNDFCFGTDTMNKIVRALRQAGIEYIELGYLDINSGSAAERSRYSHVRHIRENIAPAAAGENVSFLAMIDYGKYPAEELPPCRETGIDTIRVCFHKKDEYRVTAFGRDILAKGYRLMLQPMICSKYTDREFERLIGLFNEELSGAAAFYIVDSFGSMQPGDIRSRLECADRLLNDGAAIGLHTHNNMGLSFENIMAASGMTLHHPLILDGSLYGMGKGSGNMQTEILADYLNRHHAKTYETEILKKTAEDLIYPLQDENLWGYHEEYFLSAKYGVSPSYAKMFYGEKKVSFRELEDLLMRMPAEKRDSFDRAFAERLLAEYRGL